MSPSSAHVRVSVIIPSYNPGRAILACVESLRAQASRWKFELIVVDSSTDHTLALLEAIPGVKLIHQDDRLFPGPARNLGAEHALGEILAFIDADCTASPGWLNVMVGAHEGGHPVVGGSIANGTPKSMVGTAEYFLEFGEFAPTCAPGMVRFAPTCNFSIHRGLFEKSGGFPHLRASEDVLFGMRLQEMGVAVHFEPSAVVYHHCRTELGPFIHNQYVLGRGSAAVRRRASLPGAFVVRYPFLAPLLPALRLYRMVKRILQRNPGVLLTFLLVSPLVCTGLGAWAWGFFREAVSGEV